jgi:proteasome assembly chaperone (PAC2) family protein
MADRLIIQEQPELQEPCVVAGLKGWLNAGEASTASVSYLRRKLSARKLAEIDPRGFYVYQIPGPTLAQTLRPYARIEEGVIKQLELPRNEFFYGKSGADHDLILFLGVEPNLEWPEYAQAILDLARRFQARRLYFLGGVFDQVPHTRETRIFASLSHPRLKDELKAFAHFTEYEGPCSFTTMLLAQAREQGMEAVGLSARAPVYIQGQNPKACYALLKHLLTLTGIDLDLSDLKKASEALVETVDKAFSQNPEAMAQLKKLEEAFDAALRDEPLQGPSEDFVKQVEEMLKRQREDGEHN